KGDFNGKRQSMNRPIPVFSWGNTLKLTKNFTAEVDYTFTGKGNQRIYQLDKPTHVLDVAIRKTFLNNALSLELKGTDLFKDRGDRVRMWSGDYMIKQKNIFGSREVVFTLRYKFNSAKSKYKGTGAGDQQKNRM
ncbi:MAG: outer membrane beta-barrel protein, partial [Bacteroidaceae bacterium]|nr:outer membrane beta-barrel protein [Bacteroidaceae bacterium]